MPEHALEGRRILILEDEYMLADDLRVALEDQGSVVVGPVARVADAMEAVGKDRIDAAVLDINLGGEKSFPVADALLARDVPLLFATGYGEGDVPPRYAGVTRCEKPFETRDIVKALSRAVSQS